MEKLENGTILYHGSYCVVNEIDLSKCRAGKDFGKGFYLTTSYEQAERFVRMSIRNAMNIGTLKEAISCGYVNEYVFHSDNNVCEFDFQDANVEWLHFVTGNRDQGLFQESIQELEKYNVIGGKIANDRTAATLNQYAIGTFGIPGSKEADEIAIRLLLPNKLENQYCFRDDVAINGVRFLSSEKVLLG